MNTYLFTELFLYYLPVYLIIWYICIASPRESFTGHCLGVALSSKYSALRVLGVLLFPLVCMYQLSKAAILDYASNVRNGEE